MHGVCGDSARVAREIDCQFSPATDRIVKAGILKGVCKVVWGAEKVEAQVASICRCSVRTAARYLSGEIDPPAILFAAIFMELMPGP